MTHVREKLKPWYKLSYKLFKEEYGYYSLIEISPFTTLVMLKYFLGGIQHCITVVGKWVFDIDFTFALPITRENLD